jgi:rhamnogalacturonyl hydrolase YesR
MLKETADELCLGYMPLPMTMRVMDVSILVGTVIARHSSYSGDSKHIETAHKLVRYVVNQQTEYAAWFYTDPPKDSHITHDNYHTGFILDALHRYMQATNDTSYLEAYKKGLDFYAKHLFNSDGSPRWMNEKDFPHDIHGSAQGIITFSRHLDDYPELAQKITEWTLANMYHEEGRFYYQQTPWFTKRFTLLRWCNAWMFRAVARLFDARERYNISN